MVIEIQENTVADDSWNDRLLCPLGTVYQTKEYASFTELALDWESIFIKFVNQRGEIVGQLMLSTYPRFGNKGLLHKTLKNILGQKKMVCRWVYGPVIFDNSSVPDIRRSLYDFLISKGYRVSGSEHPLSNSGLSLERPFQNKTWSTYLIDLSEKHDMLWAKLEKHSARKNIERSQERGVKVREMNRSDLKLYYEMLQETKHKAGVEVELSSVEILWEILHPIGLTGFLALENEIPVGGIIISSFNKYVNEWGIARSERDIEAKLYSQDLLKWKIIEWGINNEFRYYDLSGVNPNPKDEKESGILRYKKKFGGNLIKYNLISL